MFVRAIPRILLNVATRADLRKAYCDRAIEALWNAIPRTVRSLRVTQAVGGLIHWRVRRLQARDAGAAYTCFFRNPAQLEVLRDIVIRKPAGAPLRMAVLGCSTGAELYSAVWVARTVRPPHEVRAAGVDILPTHVEKAACGVYQLDSKEVVGIPPASYQRLFTQEANALRVQDWVREGVSWRVGDVCSPEFLADLGLQDIVLANNFLCHLSPGQAGACLRNIARIVAPNGYLFVWGVDLDVRSRVVRELGLVPVLANLERIHTADDGAVKSWPLRYWGAEPINKRRPDWPLRYTTIFKVPAGAARPRGENAQPTRNPRDLDASRDISNHR